MASHGPSNVPEGAAEILPINYSKKLPVMSHGKHEFAIGCFYWQIGIMSAELGISGVTDTILIWCSCA